MALKKTKYFTTVSSAANARTLKSDKDFGYSALRYAETDVTKAFDFFAKVKNKELAAIEMSQLTVDMKKKFDETKRDFPLDSKAFESITSKWINNKVDGSPDFLKPAILDSSKRNQSAYISNITANKWRYDDEKMIATSSEALVDKLENLDMQFTAISDLPHQLSSWENNIQRINNLVETHLGEMIGPYELSLGVMNERGYNGYSSLENIKKLKEVQKSVEKRRIAAVYKLLPDEHKDSFINDYILFQTGYQNERIKADYGEDGIFSMAWNAYDSTKDIEIRREVIEYATSLKHGYIVETNAALSSEAEEKNNYGTSQISWDKGEAGTLNNAHTILLALNAGHLDLTNPSKTQSYFNGHSSTQHINKADAIKDFDRKLKLVNNYLKPILEDHSFLLPSKEEDKQWLINGVLGSFNLSRNLDTLIGSKDDIEQSGWGVALTTLAKMDIIPNQISSLFTDLKHIDPKNPEGADIIKRNMGIFNYIKDANPNFDFTKLTNSNFYEWAWVNQLNRAGSNNEIIKGMDTFFNKGDYNKRLELLRDELKFETHERTNVTDLKASVFDKDLYDILNSWNVKRDFVTETYLQISDFLFSGAAELLGAEPHIQKYWNNQIQTFEEAPDGVKAILENGLFGTELSWVPGKGWVQGLTPYVGQVYIDESKRQLIYKQWEKHYLNITDKNTVLNSDEGKKFSKIAMMRAINDFANWEVNSTTHNTQAYVTQDIQALGNEKFDLRSSNLELSPDTEAYKKNLERISEIDNELKVYDNLKALNFAPSVEKYFDVSSKTAKAIMGADAQFILTDFYNNNKAEYIEIFGDIDPKLLVRQRKFTDGIKVHIKENSIRPDGKPSMQLLIRDANGNMYNLNELTGESEYRLYTSDFKLDNGLEFNYANIKEHAAIDQANYIIDNLNEIIPLSDGVHNFLYETFRRTANLAYTVGNWEVAVPNISNLWQGNINDKDYWQLSFAKWKKKNMFNDKKLKWWGMSLDDQDSVDINAIGKMFGWIFNATDVNGKVFEYESAITDAVFEIATKQKMWKEMEAAGVTSKTALREPPDVPYMMFSANLDFSKFVLGAYNKKTLPFTYRTNNPLGLWSSNEKWDGKITTPEKSRLEVFINPSYGIRAALINIANKSLLVKGHDTQNVPKSELAAMEAVLGTQPTLYDFIAKGHKSENVASYMATFKKLKGWPKDHRINLKDESQMREIVSVMMYHEMGKTEKGEWKLDLLYTDKGLLDLIIKEGVSMYLDDTKWLNK